MPGTATVTLKAPGTNTVLDTYTITFTQGEDDTYTDSVLTRLPGDVNGDGNITAADVRKILRITVGKN